MADTTHVLVVGGGIAGLATARALIQRGAEVDVVERAPRRSHPGAGVYLPANAVRALGALQVGDVVLDRAHPISRQRFLDRRGRVLLEVDLRSVWGSVGPCVAISHRDLHEVLADGIPVRMGTTVTTLAPRGARVHAVLHDGSARDHDLVVGADGVRSWVRDAAFGGGEPRFLHQVSWRFLVEGWDEITSWTVHLGSRAAFLTVPLGRGLTYCCADADAPTGVDPVAGDPEALARRYAGFAHPVPTLVNEFLGSGGTPHFTPIQEVDHTPWVKGSTVLVGDAAHAMSPNMAEGVGMALEDALVLADVASHHLPLTRYEDRRRPRVRFVRAQTHRRDRTRALPRLARDTVLRLVGQRIFRSNYSALVPDP